MPSVDQIANLQSRSRMVHSLWVSNAATTMKGGGFYYRWADIFAIHQLNVAMDTQVLAEDYTSDTTSDIYEKLQCFVGSQFIDGVTLDPNAQQAPGVIYVGSNPNPDAASYRTPITITTTTIGWDTVNDQYINTSLAGLTTFKVFINSLNRFSTLEDDGWQILSGGGFSFDPTKFVLLPGDTLIVIF